MNKNIIEKVKGSYIETINNLSNILLSPHFFNNYKKLNQGNCTEDFDVAMSLYMEQDPPDGYTSYPDLINDPPTEHKWSELIWNNIDYDTELKIREIENFYIHEVLRNLVEEISQKNNWHYFWGFVYSDFTNILRFYAYKLWSGDDVSSIFLDNQYKVYKNGGFPYGWKGSYPEGNILVYLPVNREKLNI